MQHKQKKFNVYNVKRGSKVMLRHDFACCICYSPRVLPYEDLLQLLKQR